MSAPPWCMPVNEENRGHSLGHSITHRPVRQVTASSYKCRKKRKNKNPSRVVLSNPTCNSLCHIFTLSCLLCNATETHAESTGCCVIDGETTWRRWSQGGAHRLASARRTLPSGAWIAFWGPMTLASFTGPLASCMSLAKMVRAMRSRHHRVSVRYVRCLHVQWFPFYRRL